MLASLPKDLYYPLLTAFLIGAMVVLIPRRALRTILPFALAFGGMGSLFIALIFSTLLNLYYYTDYGPLHLFQIPVWLVLAWAPAMAVFLYFLPLENGRVWFWLYIVIFSALSAGLGTILNNLGLLHYIHWSPIHRFILAFGLFYLTARLTPRENLFL